jgi:hemerythrin-like domain-containing protein
MRITDRLRAEHGVFLWQLRTLEELQAEGAYPEMLRAVVEVLARAEEHHAQLEERVFFPALAQLVGSDDLRLRGLYEDHERLRELTERIRHEDFGPEDIRRYVTVAREHFEREIHGVFVLAEEVMSDTDLAGMANWNVDHLYEAIGRPAPWARN